MTRHKISRPGRLRIDRVHAGWLDNPNIGDTLGKVLGHALIASTWRWTDGVHWKWTQAV